MPFKFAFTSMGLILAIAPASAAIAQTAKSDAAAHAIAEKFSGAAEAKRKAEAEKAAAEAQAKAEKKRRIAEQIEESRRREIEGFRQREAARQAAERARVEEEEMLARARREAAEREDAQKKALEAEAQAARARAEAEEYARREAAKAEAERVQRAAAEAERERQREAEKRAEAERVARADEERRQQAELQRREEQRREEQRQEEQRKTLEAEREAEARRVAEKHNRLREEREAQRRSSDAEQTTSAGIDEQRPVAAARDLEPRPHHQTAGDSGYRDSRVTILLAMTPGTRGIRRYQKTADPVLCAGPTCWLSTGPREPAMRVTRQKALGAGNTLGARAWSCRRTLDCVFRGVDVDALTDTSLQPIDLGFLKHHRRETAEVRADHTCEVEMGRLSCGKPVEMRTWRAWIVPESVALEAGPELLRSALASGLPELHEASWRR